MYIQVFCLVVQTTWPRRRDMTQLQLQLQPWLCAVGHRSAAPSASVQRHHPPASDSLSSRTGQRAVKRSSFPSLPGLNFSTVGRKRTALRYEGPSVGITAGRATSSRQKTLTEGGISGARGGSIASSGEREASVRLGVWHNRYLFASRTAETGDKMLASSRPPATTVVWGEF